MRDFMVMVYRLCLHDDWRVTSGAGTYCKECDSPVQIAGQGGLRGWYRQDFMRLEEAVQLAHQEASGS